MGYLLRMRLITFLFFSQNLKKKSEKFVNNSSSCFGVFIGVLLGVVIEKQKAKPQFYGGIALCALVSIQIIMGTQVREGIDIVSRQLGEANGADWVNNLPNIYQVHKFFYYLLLPLTLFWLYRMHDLIPFQKVLRTQSFAVFALLLTEIILGISMHRFAIPAFIQPLHLTVAVSLLAVLLAQTMNLKLNRK